MAETLTTGRSKQEIDARRVPRHVTSPEGSVGQQVLRAPRRAHRRRRLFGASTVVLTTPAHAASAAAGPVRIHDVQGSTRLSPYAGEQVTDVAGIVTGVRGYGSSKGFWMQDPLPDADPATSEGVFVFTSRAPEVAVGDAVTVSGTVSEYVPGGTSSGTSR